MNRPTIRRIHRQALHFRVPFAVLVCAWLALLAGPTFAQEPSSVFIDRVDVNVINVEVFVTDRDGNRVRGLTAEDFEIFEDGRPVELTNFYAVDRQPRVDTNLASDRALVQGDTPPVLEELPEDQQLNLVVYIDNFNLRPGSRNRVLAQMEGFVEDRLSQGDRVMFVTFNRSIEVLTPFTSDRAEIDEGIRRVRKMAGSRELVEADRREVMRDINFYALGSQRDPESSYEAAIDRVRSFVEQAEERLEQSSEGLRSITRSLSGLPGRKAVLYVSDGISQLPGQELYTMVFNTFSNAVAATGGRQVARATESFDFYRPDLFEGIVADANAHQVTFYTLDARGSTGTSLLSAENETLGTEGAGMAELDSVRNANLVAPMVNMAERTGGTAIRNTNNFDDALARVGRDFDSFYSLGFRSPRGGDGNYHEIDVRVKREGLTARHRSGYVDKPEIERMADRTLSSLLLEAEKNPLGIGVDFGPPQKQKKNRYILPMIIRIPVRDLALLPQGDTEQGRLTLFVAVRDEEGGISDMHQLPLPLSFSREQLTQARTSEIAYRTNLEIGGGTPKVAVGVWDELSGTQSFIHKRVLLEEENKKRRGRRGDTRRGR